MQTAPESKARQTPLPGSNEEEGGRGGDGWHRPEAPGGRTVSGTGLMLYFAFYPDHHHAT